MKQKTIPIAIRFSSKTVARIQKAADRLGISRSGVVRLAIQDHLDDVERAKKNDREQKNNERYTPWAKKYFEKLSEKVANFWMRTTVCPEIRVRVSLMHS